jgi:hypothetical protein
MRAACLALALVAGCHPTDPDLNNPCGQRVDAGVDMGIGQFDYVRLGANQGPLLQTDLSLGEFGDYIWLGVGCQGIGPDVTMTFGVRDTATGAELTGQGPDSATGRLQLQYRSDLHKDVWPGLQASFPTMNAKVLVGRSVTVWADVTDADCPPLVVHGQQATRVEGFDITTCEGCLAQACWPELAECDDDCRALQGCIDAYCVGLSRIGSDEEETCLEWCQSQHPKSKDAHVSLVGCVQASGCNTQTCFPNPHASDPDPLADPVCSVEPPCHPYSIDLRHCKNLQNAPNQNDTACNPNDVCVRDCCVGPCCDALCACNASPECLDYQTCIKSCTTWADCQACSATPAGQKGEALDEAYQTCVEKTCITQSWLPHLDNQMSSQ